MKLKVLPRQFPKSVIKKIRGLILLFIIQSTCCFSQNETSQWYFGNYGALNFLTNPPNSLSTSAMGGVPEGCASIANGSGTILFYTDGITVWNAGNAVMANGTGLLGGGTSDQSSVILKKPGNQSLYYLFTEGGQGTGKLAYSIIDMSLAAGMGSVTVKNVTLSINMTEKLTATKHCNGTDYWVLGHKMNTNEFEAYQLTSIGVSNTPVVSAYGTVHSNGTFTITLVYCGGMKLSPNGKKLGVCVYGPIHQVELYDFNALTGVVSNSLNLGTCYYPYSCEFSADGTKLYASCVDVPNQPQFNGQIMQWDLCAVTQSSVPLTQTLISSQSMISLQTLQLANDGKIYVARTGQQHLDVIQDPNSLGAACNYSVLGLALSSGTCNGGLPNFSSDWFRQKPVFTSSVNCANASFVAPQFCAGTGYSVTAYNWSFGDAASGSANTSTLANPVHAYSSGGTYTAQLILNYSCGSDTLKQIINSGLPVISLTGKTSLCNKESVTLTASGANTYSWSNGGTTASTTLSPTITTVYTVTGTFSSTGCSGSKVVTLTVLPCTGIYEEDLRSNFRFYPNPNDGNVTVEGFHSSTQVNVYSQLGEKVYSETVNVPSAKLNLGYLENGIYFIETVNKGNRSVSKFIKQ